MFLVMHLIITGLSLLCEGLISCLNVEQPVLSLPVCLVKCQGPIILSFFIWAELLPLSPGSCCKQPS